MNYGAQEPTQEIQDTAARLGCRVSTLSDNSRVYQVRPGFSDSEWLDLISAESDLLPACCGAVSSIRDILLSAARNDRWLDCRSIDEIRDLLNASGHLRDFPPPNPLGKILGIREAFRPYWRTERPHAADLGDLPETLSDASLSGLWEWIVKHGFKSFLSDHGKDARSRAQHNYDLANVLPVVRALHEGLETLRFPPIDAWAVFSGGKILKLSTGDLAVFNTQEEAGRQVSWWIKDGQVRAEDIENFPVRVSLERGVEILSREDFKPYQPEPRKATPLETKVAYDHLAAIKREVLNPHVLEIVKEAEAKLRPLSYRPPDGSGEEGDRGFEF